MGRKKTITLGRISCLREFLPARVAPPYSFAFFSRRWIALMTALSFVFLQVIPSGFSIDQISGSESTRMEEITLDEANKRTTTEEVVIPMDPMMDTGGISVSSGTEEPAPAVVGPETADGTLAADASGDAQEAADEAMAAALMDMSSNNITGTTDESSNNTMEGDPEAEEAIRQSLLAELGVLGDGNFYVDSLELQNDGTYFVRASVGTLYSLADGTMWSPNLREMSFCITKDRKILKETLVAIYRDTAAPLFQGDMSSNNTAPIGPVDGDTVVRGAVVYQGLQRFWPQLAGDTGILSLYMMTQIPVSSVEVNAAGLEVVTFTPVYGGGEHKVALTPEGVLLVDSEIGGTPNELFLAELQTRLSALGAGYHVEKVDYPWDETRTNRYVIWMSEREGYLPWFSFDLIDGQVIAREDLTFSMPYLDTWDYFYSDLELLFAAMKQLEGGKSDLDALMALTQVRDIRMPDYRRLITFTWEGSVPSGRYTCSRWTDWDDPNWSEKMTLVGPVTGASIQAGIQERFGTGIVTAFEEKSDGYIFSFSGTGLPSYLSGLKMTFSLYGEFLGMDVPTGIDLGLIYDGIRTYWTEHHYDLWGNVTEISKSFGNPVLDPVFNRLEAMFTIRNVEQFREDEIYFELGGKYWKCSRGANEWGDIFATIEESGFEVASFLSALSDSLDPAMRASFTVSNLGGGNYGVRIDAPGYWGTPGRLAWVSFEVSAAGVSETSVKMSYVDRPNATNGYGYFRQMKAVDALNRPDPQPTALMADARGIAAMTVLKVLDAGTPLKYFKYWKNSSGIIYRAELASVPITSLVAAASASSEVETSASSTDSTSSANSVTAGTLSSSSALEISEDEGDWWQKGEVSPAASMMIVTERDMQGGVSEFQVEMQAFESERSANELFLDELRNRLGEGYTVESTFVGQASVFPGDYDLVVITMPEREGHLLSYSFLLGGGSIAPEFPEDLTFFMGYSHVTHHGLGFLFNAMRQIPGLNSDMDVLVALTQISLAGVYDPSQERNLYPRLIQFTREHEGLSERYFCYRGFWGDAVLSGPITGETIASALRAHFGDGLDVSVDLVDDFSREEAVAYELTLSGAALPEYLSGLRIKFSIYGEFLSLEVPSGIDLNLVYEAIPAAGVGEDPRQGPMDDFLGRLDNLMTATDVTQGSNGELFLETGTGYLKCYRLGGEARAEAVILPSVQAWLDAYQSAGGFYHLLQYVGDGAYRITVYGPESEGYNGQMWMSWFDVTKEGLVLDSISGGWYGATIGIRPFFDALKKLRSEKSDAQVMALLVRIPAMVPGAVSGQFVFSLLDTAFNEYKCYPNPNNSGLIIIEPSNLVISEFFNELSSRLDPAMNATFTISNLGGGNYRMRIDAPGYWGTPGKLAWLSFEVSAAGVKETSVTMSYVDRPNATNGYGYFRQMKAVDALNRPNPQPTPLIADVRGLVAMTVLKVLDTGTPLKYFKYWKNSSGIIYKAYLASAPITLAAAASSAASGVETSAPSAASTSAETVAVVGALSLSSALETSEDEGDWWQKGESASEENIVSVTERNAEGVITEYQVAMPGVEATLSANDVFLGQLRTKLGAGYTVEKYNYPWGEGRPNGYIIRMPEREGYLPWYSFDLVDGRVIAREDLTFSMPYSEDYFYTDLVLLFEAMKRLDGGKSDLDALVALTQIKDIRMPKYHERILFARQGASGLERYACWEWADSWNSGITLSGPITGQTVQSSVQTRVGPAIGVALETLTDSYRLSLSGEALPAYLTGVTMTFSLYGDFISIDVPGGLNVGMLYQGVGLEGMLTLRNVSMGTDGTIHFETDAGYYKCYKETVVSYGYFVDEYIRVEQIWHPWMQSWVDAYRAVGGDVGDVRYLGDHVYQVSAGGMWMIFNVSEAGYLPDSLYCFIEDPSELFYRSVPYRTLFDLLKNLDGEPRSDIETLAMIPRAFIISMSEGPSMGEGPDLLSFQMRDTGRFYQYRIFEGETEPRLVSDWATFGVALEAAARDALIERLDGFFDPLVTCTDTGCEMTLFSDWQRDSLVGEVFRIVYGRTAAGSFEATAYFNDGSGNPDGAATPFLLDAVKSRFPGIPDFQALLMMASSKVLKTELYDNDPDAYRFVAEDLHGVFADTVLTGRGLPDDWGGEALSALRARILNGETVTKGEWAEVLNSVLPLRWRSVDDYARILGDAEILSVLDAEIRALLERAAQDPADAPMSSEELMRLNRRILEACYPQQLDKTHVQGEVSFSVDGGLTYLRFSKAYVHRPEAPTEPAVERRTVVIDPLSSLTVEFFETRRLLGLGDPRELSISLYKRGQLDVRLLREALLDDDGASFLTLEMLGMTEASLASTSNDALELRAIAVLNQLLLSNFFDGSEGDFFAGWIARSLEIYDARLASGGLSSEDFSEYQKFKKLEALFQAFQVKGSLSKAGKIQLNRSLMEALSPLLIKNGTASNMDVLYDSFLIVETAFNSFASGEISRAAFMANASYEDVSFDGEVASQMRLNFWYGEVSQDSRDLSIEDAELLWTAVLRIYPELSPLEVFVLFSQIKITSIADGVISFERPGMRYRCSWGPTDVVVEREDAIPTRQEILDSLVSAVRARYGAEARFELGTVVRPNAIKITLPDQKGHISWIIFELTEDGQILPPDAGGGERIQGDVDLGMLFSGLKQFDQGLSGVEAIVELFGLRQADFDDSGSVFFGRSGILYQFSRVEGRVRVERADGRSLLLSALERKLRILYGDSFMLGLNGGDSRPTAIRVSVPGGDGRISSVVFDVADDGTISGVDGDNGIFPSELGISATFQAMQLLDTGLSDLDALIEMFRISVVGSSSNESGFTVSFVRDSGNSIEYPDPGYREVYQYDFNYSNSVVLREPLIVELLRKLGESFTVSAPSEQFPDVVVTLQMISMPSSPNRLRSLVFGIRDDGTLQLIEGSFFDASAPQAGVYFDADLLFKALKQLNPSRSDADILVEMTQMSIRSVITPQDALFFELDSTKEEYKCYRDAEDPEAIHLMGAPIDVQSLADALTYRFGGDFLVTYSDDGQEAYLSFPSSDTLLPDHLWGLSMTIAVWGGEVLAVSGGVGLPNPWLLYEGVHLIPPQTSHIDALWRLVETMAITDAGAEEIYFELEGWYWHAYIGWDDEIVVEWTVHPWMRPIMEQLGGVFSEADGYSISVGPSSHGIRTYEVTIDYQNDVTGYASQIVLDFAETGILGNSLFVDNGAGVEAYFEGDSFLLLLEKVQAIPYAYYPALRAMSRIYFNRKYQDQDAESYVYIKVPPITPSGTTKSLSDLWKVHVSGSELIEPWMATALAYMWPKIGVYFFKNAPYIDQRVSATSIGGGVYRVTVSPLGGGAQVPGYLEWLSFNLTASGIDVTSIQAVYFDRPLVDIIKYMEGNVTYMGAQGVFSWVRAKDLNLQLYGSNPPLSLTQLEKDLRGVIPMTVLHVESIGDWRVGDATLFSGYGTKVYLNKAKTQWYYPPYWRVELSKLVPTLAAMTAVALSPESAAAALSYSAMGVVAEEGVLWSDILDDSGTVELNDGDAPASTDVPSGGGLEEGSGAALVPGTVISLAPVNGSNFALLTDPSEQDAFSEDYYVEMKSAMLSDAPLEIAKDAEGDLGLAGSLNVVSKMLSGFGVTLLGDPNETSPIFAFEQGSLLFSDLLADLTV